ncbi:hypothetical protein QUF64_02765 [Anaerolineales bacterium HSG6]|nr:hypothetical protein [Anaerolineales bacterium HSG6]MDM8530337.1 hypothetical protein [Anaerolineales bacterium HSG25]
MDTSNKQSWATRQEARLNGLNQELDQVQVSLNDLRVSNQTDHIRLTREAEQAIAQITVDGQFLNHVREIIRFVKTA